MHLLPAIAASVLVSLAGAGPLRQWPLALDPPPTDPNVITADLAGLDSLIIGCSAQTKALSAANLVYQYPGVIQCISNVVSTTSDDSTFFGGQQTAPLQGLSQPEHLMAER